LVVDAEIAIVGVALLLVLSKKQIREDKIFTLSFLGTLTRKSS